jgi:hypothetical protein
LPDWFIGAVCNDLNGRVWMDRRRVLWCEPEGAAGQALAIGRCSEGPQLFFTLSCGAHHHLRTPKAVTSGKKLLCAWCEAPGRLAAARVRGPTEPERDMHAALERAALGTVCVHETRRPFWHGQLDFWFPRLGLAVQVDGPRHFAAEPAIPQERQQAAIDLQMCKAAWGAGVGLVRVHHLQASTNLAAADVRQALALRLANPTAPLLIRGAGFNPATAAALPGQRDAAAFVAALKRALATEPTAWDSGALAFQPCLR